MNYHTFISSINSLRGYFAKIAEYGYDGRDFDDIRQLGIYQEQKMLKATNDINTHKGAIFNLGLMAATVGRCILYRKCINAQSICDELMTAWQYDLLHRLPRNPHSHGQKIYQSHGITGAIEMAADGFKIVRELALPCYYQTLTQSQDANKAKTQTLMTLIAHLDDTNLVWRGGIEGLRLGQDLARGFLSKGGVFADDWQNDLLKISDKFIQKNLSPGGSADLLAVTLFLAEIENEFGDFI